MNQFVHKLVWGCLSFFMIGAVVSTQGQSVFNPNDPIVIYNPSNPPTEPVFGQPGKWVKTNRLPWNTSSFKAYIYKGIPFRLKFPKNYDASGATKYPLLLFIHGKGEVGTKYDNEYQLFHGGELHKNAVDNGQFNGFLMYPQTNSATGAFTPTERQFVKEVVENFLIPQVNIDPFRVNVNGLSAGGYSVWQFMISYPKFVASISPISSAASSYSDQVIQNKFTPIWLFQGALDQQPVPAHGQYLNSKAQQAGANFKYTEYPNQGHGCWYTAWNEPDYFPFLTRANKLNPWPLYGKTEFCFNGPGSINTTIGVTAGFEGYQWKKGDQILTGLGTNANTLTVTDIGVYSCKILRGTTWSEWSPIPVEIKYKTATIPPVVTVSGLASKVLPAPDGKTTVSLQVPSGYSGYNWQKVGDPSGTPPLSTGNVLIGATVGSYKVQVTEQFGCSSAFTDPFEVINANGPNKPDAATNLIVIPLSYTSLKLNWSSNPNPVHPQTNFEVYEATQASGPYKFVSLVEPNVYSFVKDGLTPGTKYFYIIRAVNATAASSVSNEASAITQKDSKPPTAPGNLVITGTTRNSASMRWDESSDDVGMDHYEIYVNGIKSYVTSGNEFTVYNLEYAKTYNFSVKAIDIAGNKSAPSNQVTTQALAKGLNYKHYIGTWDNLPDFNTLTPILTGEVPNVIISNTTQAENYAFLWEGYIHIPSNGTYIFSTTSDDGSKLYLAPYSYTATALVNNDGLQSSTTEQSQQVTLNKGIYPITIAYFQQGGGSEMSVAWRKTGSSGWSMTAIPDSAFVDPPPIPAGTAPAKPSNLSATAASFKRINLSWTDNSNNEKSFEIFRSTDPLNSFVTIGVLPANTNSFADTLVTPSTTYFYKIRAINQFGESDFDKTGPGIDYAYYEKTGMSQIPDFNLLTPLRTGRVNTIALGMQLRPDDFAVKFDGFITIATTGDYTFYLSSDDGSRLYINNSQVVNNDGLHGSGSEVNEVVHLNAGVYPIRVTFFERGGSEVLNVKYRGPGVNKQDIPANVLGEILANATTLAPPPVPATPTNLTALGISNSAIKVAWVNNAVNATANELYRSYNGNTDYVLLTTLPATARSFIDTALYPSSMFYYKVRAIGEGGASAYSNEISSRTLGIIPSVIPIENVYMRFNTQLQVPIEAVSGSPVNITLQVSNLPLFAAFQPTGNGKGVITFNPAESDAGVYPNIIVTAANPQNEINTAKFNLTVNNNYVPQINSISNVSVNEKQTLQITLAATDTDASDQLVWTFPGLPAFVSTAGSNRTATVTLAPQYGQAGVYTVKARVNDGRNGTDTASFKVTVVHVNVPNPNDGTAPLKPTDVAVQFDNNTDAVKVTWTNMAYNAASNEIYRSSFLSGGYTLLNPGDTNKDSTSFTDYTATGNRTYFYLVRAVNANGGTNSAIIKIITPNKAPVIANSGDIFVRSNTPIDANITATDDPGNTISLSVTNLPAFASFTDNGNGRGTVHLAPTGSHVGAYTVTVRAEDNYGAVSTKLQKIIVADQYIKSVYVNFNNSSYPVSAKPWNSMNAIILNGQTKPNTILSNLKDEVGQPSGINITLVDTWPQNQNGVITGNNTGVFPDSVMKTGYYVYIKPTVPQKTIKLSGLSDTMKYNLQFFGNTSGSGNLVTNYSVGTTTVSLNVANNTLNTVQINALSPDENGEISIVVKAPGEGYVYINAMVIQAYHENIILPPTNLKLAGSTKNSIKLSWKSTAENITGFEVWRSDTPEGTYIKLPGSIPGNVFTFTDGGLPAGQLFYYKVRAVSGALFSAFSDRISAATILYSVNINFNDGSTVGPSQPAPWNNTNQLVYEGFTLPNLLNENNENTGINMTVVGSLNAYSGTNRIDNSLTTGDNSGAVPDIVMSTFYFLEYTQVGKLRIDGLNQAMRYNFVFFGGCKDRGNGQTTTYSIGDESVQLNAKNNTMNTIQINNVQPDADGSVLISLTPSIIGGFGYINSLTIQATPSAPDGGISGRTTAGGKNANASVVVNSNIDLAEQSGKAIVGAYPNPFVNDIILKLSLNKKTEKLVILLRDVSGKTLFSTTLTNLPKGISERKLGLDGSKLPRGVYGIQVLGLPDSKFAGIIVVK